MARALDKLVRYLGMDVLEAARQRIRGVMDTFDSWAVSYSGGKDSLTTLHLVRQEMDAAGIKSPLEVIFRDEELIPNVVLDAVNEYRLQPERFRVHWWAVPLKSHKYVLGKTFDYVQWDPAREWVRQKPAWAITEVPPQFTPPGGVYSQYDMDEVTTAHLPGKVAVFTGVRCQEGLTRLRVVLNKKHQPHITASKAGERVSLIKPIYDWRTEDVFKFFLDNGIRYCPIYDSQVWNAQELRVSTPIHAETAKRFHLLKSMDPEFRDRVVRVFPEMLEQDRYFRDLDRASEIDAYPHTWLGLFAWIDDHITDPHQNTLAKSRVAMARTIRRNSTYGSPANLHGFPLRYVFRQIMAGNFKRMFLPENGPLRPADFEFEGLPVPAEIAKPRTRDPWANTPAP